MSVRDWFRWRRREEEHADHVREQTHDVINQLQRDILRIQRQGEDNRQRIDTLLSSSNAELASVAARIAVAVGLAERDQREQEQRETPMNDTTNHPTRGPRR